MTEMFDKTFVSDQSHAVTILDTLAATKVGKDIKRAVELDAAVAIAFYDFVEAVTAYEKDVVTSAEPAARKIDLIWTQRYGECYDCGKPAAFYDSIGSRLCSICAANYAADGDTIERIENEW